MVWSDEEVVKPGPQARRAMPLILATAPQQWYGRAGSTGPFGLCRAVGQAQEIRHLVLVANAIAVRVGRIRADAARIEA